MVLWLTLVDQSKPVAEPYFPVSDMLRDMLIKEESENAELFTDAERSEFLFRVFQHLALGGSMCQFEDSMDSYVEVTKRLYKALLVRPGG